MSKIKFANANVLFIGNSNSRDMNYDYEILDNSQLKCFLKKKIMILLNFCKVLSTYHVLDNCVEVNIRKMMLVEHSVE